MKFIDQSATSRMNEITDGHMTCVYRDIPEHFEQIRAFFQQKDIQTDDTIVLECSNTLPGALTLLYLLEEGYSFLLIPKPAADKASVNDFPGYFPPLCGYKIRTIPVRNEGPADFLPDHFLEVIANEKQSDTRRNVHADPRLYLRTSGSTGTPKMVVHSHTRLKKNAENCVLRLGLDNDHRVAIPVPIAHMFGLGAAFLPAVSVGASVDLQAGANLLRYLQREREFDPDTVFMTPVFCETLLKGRRAARPYRLTVTAGDRFRGQDTFSGYESLFGCLVNLYGSTEMGAMTAGSPDDPGDMRAQTAGSPMPDVQMRMEKLNAENHDEMSDVGILWCSHPYGFEGYADEDGNPVAQSPEASDDWFCTKDLGRIREDGSVEVLGRNDHSVNRDGLLVYFADVEDAIRTIDGIETVAVMSQGESRRGARLAAFCVPARAADMNEAQMRSSCFDLMPNRAVPDDIIFLRSLPLLPSGKVDRQKLTQMVGR